MAELNAACGSAGHLQAKGGDCTGGLQQGTSTGEECFIQDWHKMQVPWTPALTSTGPTPSPAD